MKKFLPAVGVLALAAAPVAAQLVYEPFDYGTASIGTNLAHTSTGTPDPFSGYINPMSGTQWFDGNTGIGTGTPYELSIVSGNLAPTLTSGLPSSAGNSVQYQVASTASRSGRLSIAPTAATAGTVYY